MLEGKLNGKLHTEIAKSGHFVPEIGDIWQMQKFDPAARIVRQMPGASYSDLYSDVDRDLSTKKILQKMRGRKLLEVTAFSSLGAVLCLGSLFRLTVR